jgi:hypothetical protein
VASSSATTPEQRWPQAACWWGGGRGRGRDISLDTMPDDCVRWLVGTGVGPCHRPLCDAGAWFGRAHLWMQLSFLPAAPASMALPRQRHGTSTDGSWSLHDTSTVVAWTDDGPCTDAPWSFHGRMTVFARSLGGPVTASRRRPQPWPEHQLVAERAHRAGLLWLGVTSRGTVAAIWSNAGGRIGCDKLPSRNHSLAIALVLRYRPEWVCNEA